LMNNGHIQRIDPQLILKSEPCTQ
ncbi:hypothetical protein A5845_002217, partial [Enterococcus faecium]